MSGDSPTAVHKENAFNYGEAGRSTPPPTTSFLASKQENIPPQPIPSNETNLIEVPKKEEKDIKDEVDMSSPDANPGYKPGTENKSEQKKGEDSKDGKDKEDGEKFNESSKLNGNQMLDGQWVGADVKEEEEEDNGCIVNCLYYTIQCCECTIS